MISRTLILAFPVAFAAVTASAGTGGATACRHHHVDIVQHVDVAPVARGYYLREVFVCATRYPGESPYVGSYVEGPGGYAPRPYPDIASARRAVHAMYAPAVERWMPYRGVLSRTSYRVPSRTSYRGVPSRTLPRLSNPYRDTPDYRYPAQDTDRPGVPRVKYGTNGVSIDVLSPSLADFALFGFSLTPVGRTLRGVGGFVR